MRKASSPLYYITNLTTLLESIALIIDQHQPVVEKYYGEGKMRVVVVRLQAEGDKGVKTLVEGWEEERRVGRLVSRLPSTCETHLTHCADLGDKAVIILLSGQPDPVPLGPIQCPR